MSEYAEKTNRKDAKDAEGGKIPEQNLGALCVFAVKYAFFQQSHHCLIHFNYGKVLSWLAVHRIIKRIVWRDAAAQHGLFGKSRFV